MPRASKLSVAIPMTMSQEGLSGQLSVEAKSPKGPSTQIIDKLGPKGFLYRYFGSSLHTI